MNKFTKLALLAVSCLSVSLLFCGRDCKSCRKGCRNGMCNVEDREDRNDRRENRYKRKHHARGMREEMSQDEDDEGNMQMQMEEED